MRLCSVASDLGLHCLLDARNKWIKGQNSRLIRHTKHIVNFWKLLSNMKCILPCFVFSTRDRFYSAVRVGWLCWGLTSQSTIFQSCRDGAIASWVINQYFRGVKCLAQGHNTAAVGLEPRTSRSGCCQSKFCFLSMVEKIKVGIWG